MRSDPDAPEPRASEYHPAGYPYQARFPALRPHADVEGGTVYVADAPDGYYVVTDEGTLADVLERDDPTIGIHAFDTAAQRDAYCARRFTRVQLDRSRDDTPVGGAAIRLSYKGREVPDFSALLTAYGAGDLRSPARSTVPLLACWRSWDAALADLADALGEALPGPVELAFEYRVPVHAGRGTPSHTDLMVLTPTHVVAIEAKHTEPAYESVADWLAKVRDGNRTAVLDGWLALINRTLGSSLTAGQVAACTYQLVHRTASACAPPAQWRAVVYQGFDVERSDRDVYVDQMRQLNALLGDQSTLRFSFLDCRVGRSAMYEALRARWERGERDLADAVRAGLEGGHLVAGVACSAIEV